MTKTGFYQKLDVNTGDIKRYRNCKFESTGIKFEDDPHIIWRKLNKDGSPSNVFAIQFIPDVPWMVGNWFTMVDGGYILSKHPELKVETERSASMSHDDYCKFLTSTYRAY